MQHGRRGEIRRHFNYSNVMSTLAVFLVVAGGTAMAAQVNSSRDIDKGSVKNSDLKKNTLKSNKLKNGRAVSSLDVIDNNLTGIDINEASLGLASAYNQRETDLPLSASPTDVLTTTVTTGADSRILASGVVELEADGGDNDDAGCRIQIAGTDGPQTNSSIPETTNDQLTTSAAFSRVLPAGSHAVALRCQENAAGNVSADDGELLVHSLPA
jgi:hypothetical protein